MTVAAVARKAVKGAALPLGLLHPMRAGDLSILLYHRIGDGGAEIETPAPQFDRQLRALVADGGARSLDDGLARGGVVVTFDDGTPDFHDTVLPLLVRHRVPALIYLATGQIDTGSGTLTWSQLAEALDTGLVTAGAHTHGHVDLSKAGEREAEEEMRRSKEMVQDRLGTSCDHFAFPWAVASPAARSVARRLFTSSALDAWHTNRRANLDPHRLGRAPVLRSDGIMFFRAKAKGLLDQEALAYRLAGRGPWRFG
jgi:peptidoglycan/xylan/chitin deacetylase (PgdA/CDA1 family)